MLNNPYQELNNQYHYVSQTAIQSISKRSLLSIPRRTSCSSHLWPTCREHGLCLLSIGPPFSPRTAPWSCHFYFNILISHGFLDKNQVLLHNFAKRARSSWSQMVSLRRSLFEFLAEMERPNTSPWSWTVGNPGNPEGWSRLGPSWNIQKSWHILTCTFEIHMIHGSLAVSPSIRNPANDRDELSRGNSHWTSLRYNFLVFSLVSLILSATEFLGNHQPPTDRTAKIFLPQRSASQTPTLEFVQSLKYIFIWIIWIIWIIFMYSWRFCFFLVHLGYLRIIPLPIWEKTTKLQCTACPPWRGWGIASTATSHCTIIHGPLRNCVNCVESVYQFETKTTNDTWNDIWYLISDIWYMIHDMIYDIWYLIYDMIYDIWYLIYDIWHDIWYLISDIWYMIYDMIYDIWYMIYDMIYDIWYLIYDMIYDILISDIWYMTWYMISDIWYMIYDIWYLIYDIWIKMRQSEMRCEGKTNYTHQSSRLLETVETWRHTLPA